MQLGISFTKLQEAMRRMRKRAKKHLLLILTISSVLLGFFLGFGLRAAGMKPEGELYEAITFPGEIFMQVLRMMILPLVFTSVIASLSQMDAANSKKIGLISLAYYCCTAALASTLGMVLVLTIKPGHFSTPPHEPFVRAQQGVTAFDATLDMFRNMFPANIIQATFSRSQTTYETVNVTGSSATERHKEVKLSEGINILGVIVFCTGFGIVVAQTGKKAKILAELFDALDTVILGWIQQLMWMAPLGIVSLITGALIDVEDIAGTARTLLVYVATVIAGVLLHGFVTLPTFYFLLTRKNPLTVARALIPTFVTAFGTASSGAALPVSMECAEETLKIDERISRFVFPLGSTINMDGTSTYEAVACVFIAQLHGITLTWSEILTIRDRVRTATNSLCDGYAASAVEFYMRRDLRRAASQAKNEKEPLQMLPIRVAIDSN